jgi:hypothetical protein
MVFLSKPLRTDWLLLVAFAISFALCFVTFTIGTTFIAFAALTFARNWASLAVTVTHNGSITLTPIALTPIALTPRLVTFSLVALAPNRRSITFTSLTLVPWSITFTPTT